MGEGRGTRSKTALYGDLVVGRRGIGALLKYELVTMLCAGTHGALGLFLRSKLFPWLLAECGRGDLVEWSHWGGLKPGTSIQQGDPLFPRYQVK